MNLNYAFILFIRFFEYSPGIIYVCTKCINTTLFQNCCSIITKEEWVNLPHCCIVLRFERAPQTNNFIL